MSEQAHTDFEALLRRALAPVEPPADLAARLESTLTTLTEAAAEEPAEPSAGAAEPFALPPSIGGWPPSPVGMRAPLAPMASMATARS